MLLVFHFYSNITIYHLTSLYVTRESYLLVCSHDVKRVERAHGNHWPGCPRYSVDQVLFGEKHIHYCTLAFHSRKKKQLNDLIYRQFLQKISGASIPEKNAMKWKSPKNEWNMYLSSQEVNKHTKNDSTIKSGGYRSTKNSVLKMRTEKLAGYNLIKINICIVSVSEER